jgi:3-oxoacyl-[acyl-carrier-protein] synthase III
MYQQSRAVVRGVGHYVPERIVTNHDMTQFIDTSDVWITERTGIKARRFADVKNGETTSHLAIKACQKALEAAGTKPSEIDLVIAATLSPDYFFPGLGVLVQHGLGLSNVAALDIRQQCSGFVHGASMADAFVRSGMAKRILFVCAEIQSTVMDMTTRGREMGVLFGDGAAALVIEAEPVGANPQWPTAQNSVRGFIDHVMGGDGGGAEMLIMRTPGTSSPEFISHDDIDSGRRWPKMQGQHVFKHAVTRMCESADTLLSRNGLKATDLSLVVPHQANMRINEYMREKLKLPADKVFNNIEKYGNTTAATVPLCLSEAVEQGRLKQGDLILTVAFGAGFTWGANLIRW